MTDDAANQDLSCPVCGAALRHGNLTSHVVKVHLNGFSELYSDYMKAVAIGSGDAPTDRTSCIHCNASVSKTKLALHFLRVHGSLYALSVERWQRERAARTRRISAAGAKETAKAKRPRLDLAALNDLLSRGLLPHGLVERCECGKQVVQVPVGLDKSKAHEVCGASRKLIAHVCEGARSPSIYTVAGGAVDSNRRKH